jgi:hypothetical protein
MPARKNNVMMAREMNQRLNDRFKRDGAAHGAAYPGEI